MRTQRASTRCSSYFATTSRSMVSVEKTSNQVVISRKNTDDQRHSNRRQAYGSMKAYSRTRSSSSRTSNLRLTSTNSTRLWMIYGATAAILFICAPITVANAESAFFDRFMSDVVQRSWKGTPQVQESRPTAERIWQPPTITSNTATVEHQDSTITTAEHTTPSPVVATATTTKAPEMTSSGSKPTKPSGKKPIPTKSRPKTGNRTELAHQKNQDASTTVSVKQVSGTAEMRTNAVSSHPIEIVVTTSQPVTMAAAPVQLGMFSPKDEARTTTMPTTLEHVDDELIGALLSNHYKPSNIKRSPNGAQSMAATDSASVANSVTQSGEGPIETPAATLDDGSGREDPKMLDGPQSDITTTPEESTTTSATTTPEITTTPSTTTIAPIEYVSTTPRSTPRTSTWRMTPRMDLDAFSIHKMTCGGRSKPICCKGRDDSEECSIRAQPQTSQNLTGGVCYCDEHCLTVSEDFAVPDCCPDFLDTCAQPLGINVSELVAITPKPMEAQTSDKKMLVIRTKGRSGKKLRQRPLPGRKKNLYKNYARLQKVMQAFVIDPKD